MTTTPHRIPRLAAELMEGGLVDWFRENARDLPWRRSPRDPYAVWVSEIMLQQTQVVTALPYYERWMERFPTVEALAAAPEQDVFACWSGLGYYSRARNLHLGAARVVARHGGVVPDAAETLAAVPGVGPYTTGAILSLAYDQRAAIVDGNVARVFSRVFTLPDCPRTPIGSRTLWDLAERLLPTGSSAEHNQALMELGALVCTPRNPACHTCPLKAGCRAFASGNPCAWPARRERLPVLRVRHASAVIIVDGCVLLGRRPAGGWWAGLWEAPTVVCHESETSAEGARRAALERMGLRVEVGEVLATLRHTVTRHAVELSAHRAHTVGGEAHSDWYAETAWAPLPVSARWALASPQRRSLASAAAHGQVLDGAESGGERKPTA